MNGILVLVVVRVFHTQVCVSFCYLTGCICVDRLCIPTHMQNCIPHARPQQGQPRWAVSTEGHRDWPRIWIAISIPTKGIHVRVVPKCAWLPQESSEKKTMYVLTCLVRNYVNPCQVVLKWMNCRDVYALPGNLCILLRQRPYTWTDVTWWRSSSQARWCEDQWKARALFDHANTERM